MTRIDFYFNVGNKHKTMADLVQLALAKRRQVTIYTEDEKTAANVSVDLWQNKAESFLPNVLINHDLAAQTPVLIHWHENPPLQDDMLINFSPIKPLFFSRFTQLIELVSSDEADKIAARSRFKFYRDRGYEIKSIDHAQVGIE